MQILNNIPKTIYKTTDCQPKFYISYYIPWLQSTLLPSIKPLFSFLQKTTPKMQPNEVLH